MANGMMNNNNTMPTRMRPSCPNDKKELMMEIYKYGFVVDDLKLYLDTHTEDQSAIECFNEARNNYLEAVKNYTKMYGPLLISMYDADCKWTWNMGPMPWEGEV